MNLMTPPEMADGGYWYLLPAVPDPELGGSTPGTIPGLGWGAWYARGLAVIRCPDAIDGIATTDAATVDSVLLASGATKKPYCRVGGS